VKRRHLSKRLDSSRGSCFAMGGTATMKCSSSFNFVQIFVGVQNTFMTADKLLHNFGVFRNSDVRTDRGRPLPFGHSVTPVEYFSADGPRLSWPNSSQKTSSMVLKIDFTYYGYCHSLNGATKFSNVDTKNTRLC